jgi:hypothetical protein
MPTLSPLIKIRLLIVFFILALAASGLTAIPLQWELALLNRLLSAPWSPLPTLWPALITWIKYIHEGLQAGYGSYLFLAYGTDWLAFGHIVIALAFIGPLRDPQKNIWVIEWGLMACVLVVPWAFIFGAVRQIPLFWRLVDCSFGVFGLIPLWWCRREILRLPAAPKSG